MFGTSDNATSVKRMTGTYFRNDQQRYEHEHEDAIVAVLDCLEENTKAGITNVGIVVFVMDDIQLFLNETDLESNLY